MGIKYRVLGIIPARMGSKSIPHKNMVDLGGVPMINWCMYAAREAKEIDKIVCTTDDPAVKELCTEEGIEWIHRPADLAQGDKPVGRIANNVLETHTGYNIIAWIQPTSPFVQPQTIDDCLQVLKKQKGYYKSVQTITEVPHNHHAWNQRELGPLSVKFIFENERKKAFNKQKKPKHYVFGNFIACKTYGLEGNLFRPHSKGIEIPRIEALDVDGPEDLEIARYYARTYFGAD